VVMPGEPSDIFDNFYTLMRAKVSAREITAEEGEKRVAELMSQINEHALVLEDYRGTSFVEPAEGGSRTYKQWGQEITTRRENRYLMLFGTLFTFAGIFGFFVEFRLRKVT
jgi:hypothetical protein